MLKVFVSIVNYNGEKDSLVCLKYLDSQNIKDFDLNVVVIDNASKDIFKAEQNLYKNFNFKIIRSDKNLGFAGGQNLGIKYALENEADYVVVLNNDVLIDNDLILELLRTFEENSNCGLVSPKIYFAKGQEFHKDRYKAGDLGNVIWYTGGKIDWKNLLASHNGVDEVDHGQYDKSKETDFVSGCCMMIKKEVFKKTGFFDEKYFLYYEDNDLSQRARRKGFESYYQPKALLWHLNAGSTGGSGSSLHDYYITRNRLLFGFKYASVRTKIALFKESIKIFLMGRKWQKKAVLDFYSRNLGKGSYE